MAHDLVSVRTRTPLLLTLGLLALAQSAAAQRPDTTLSADSLKRLSIEQLMNLQITSVSKRPERLAQAASAIQVITREDINREGYQTVSDILQVLSLKREFPSLKIVLVGATEGWTVADQIAASGIPVIASAANDLWRVIELPVPVRSALRDRGFTSADPANAARPWVREASDPLAAIDLVQGLFREVFGEKPDARLDLNHGSHEAEHLAEQKLAAARRRIEGVVRSIAQRVEQDADGGAIAGRHHLDRLGGKPGAAQPGLQAGDDRVRRARALRPAAQDRGIAGLEAEAARVGGHAWRIALRRGQALRDAHRALDSMDVIPRAARA